MASNPERLRLWREAKAITSKVTAEGRATLNVAERARFDDLMAGIERIDAVGHNGRQPHAHLLRPESTRNPAMPSTFSELLSRNGSALIEHRALAIGTASAGGNLAPTGFVNELWRHLEAVSPVTSVARVFTTRDEANLEVPILATYGSAGSVAEGSAIAGTDPSFTQVTLNAHRYAQLIRASNTLLNSQAVNLDGFMGELFARNIDAVTGPLYAFGTGTTQPQGYAHGAGTAIVGGTAVGGAFTYDHLADMLTTLDSGYQSNAVWLFSPSAVGTLRKLKDDESRPLWQPSVAAGEPPTLFGRPVYVDRHLGAVATNGTSVVCMAPEAYAVRFGSGGIRVDRSDDAYFSTDEVAFRAVIATDARYLDPDSAVRFVGGSA